MSIIGFAVAHFVDNIPARRQRKWRGMLLVPWVIPAAMSTIGWRLLFDPSFSPWNWLLQHVGIGPVMLARRARLGAPLRHLGERVVRRAVLHGDVPGVAEVGAPGALRGGVDRRRRLVAAPALRDLPADAQHHRHHHAVRPDRQLHGLHARGRADQRWPAGDDPGAGHRGVPPRHRGRQPADGLPPCRCACCRSWRCARPSSCGALPGGGAGATPDGRARDEGGGDLQEPDRQGHGRGAGAGNGHHRHQDEVDQTVTLATGHFSCSWNYAAADKLRFASRVLNETPRAAPKSRPGVFFLHQKL